MKRIAYFTITALAILAGCTKFAQDEEYDLGATTAPTVSAKVVDDNTVNITVAGAEGNGYYSYALIAGETEEIDPATLLSDGYSDIALASGCCNFKDTPSVSKDVKKLSPNTVYTLYAVAANANGVLSELVTKEITTSDETVPDIITYESEIDDDGIMWLYAKFDDPVELTGEGHAHLLFFAVFGETDEDGNLIPVKTVDVPAEDLAIEDNWLCVAVPEDEAQPGAIVALTFDAGIVKNALGAKNPAYGDAIIPSDPEEDFDAICEQFDTESWDLILKYLDLKGGAGIIDWPEDHIEKFSNWRQLMILVGCDCEKVYGPDGVAELTFATPSGKKIVQDFEPANVMGNLLTFRLPEDPGNGSFVNFTIPEEMFFDIWGNPNAGLESEGQYLSSFGYTPEDFFGNFNLTTVGEYSGESITEAIVISEAEYDPDDYDEDPEYDFQITGNIMGLPIDSPVYGWFDCDGGKLIMENEQPFYYEYDEEEEVWYEFCLLDYDDQTGEFTISHPDKNTYTTSDEMDILIYIYDAEWNYLGYDFYDYTYTFKATRAGGVPSIIILDKKAPVAKHARPSVSNEIKRK